MEQALIVATIIVAAAGYLGRRTWKSIAASRQAKTAGPGCSGKSCCH